MVFCNLVICITENAVYCHNPYFNRWFSAIWGGVEGKAKGRSHNPYFNRWFSAILGFKEMKGKEDKSQSLF